MDQPGFFNQRDCQSIAQHMRQYGNRRPPNNSRNRKRVHTPGRRALVQAPEGGIPPRVGKKLGFADCEIIVIARFDTATYDAGDLVRTGEFILVFNYTTKSPAGEDGDRVCKVDSHAPGAYVEGWSCENDGSPEDIPLRE